MQFMVNASNVTHKFLDTSFLAVSQKIAPPTMGFRTQTMKLRFATSDIKGMFLKSHYSFQDTFDIVERKSGDPGLKQAKFLNVLIGKTVSLIYSPFYVKNDSLYDGILDRAVCKMNMDIEGTLNEKDSNNNWEIKFMSALCPDCGGDLSGSRSSIVLTCGNCSTCWHPTDGSMKRVEHKVQKCRERDMHYFPFWKLSVDIRGIKIASFADLIRTANFPRVIMPWMENRKLYFYSPAFHVRPKTFMRLTKQLTMIQPEGEYSKEIPKASICAASLDDKEAFETVKITLANMTAVKRKVFPLLSDMKVRAGQAELVYIPFIERGNEYIHPEHKFSIQRNAIRMA